LANCSGGQTPWGTALSCEENYQLFYGEDSVDDRDLDDTYRWLEEPSDTFKPEHYGWVVEVDPYTGTAKKLTSMGRFRHENVAIGIGKSGKVVAYMGDDDTNQCVYKFISEGSYNPNDRAANMNLLEAGTLYAADFGSGTWIPMVFEGNEETLTDSSEVRGYDIDSQADVLTYAAACAVALGATRTDRPEDLEIHPFTGHIYISFSNNSNHGNFHGQIVRLMEKDDDHESLEFGWDIFAVGGPQSGFSSPDNLVFDSKGNLWMMTDVSNSGLNNGIYTFNGNNSMFFMPTEGENYGKAFRFASGPVMCEMAGPTFLGSDTLFVSIQHPGDESESLDKLRSHWPTGGDAIPRSAVIAITGPFNN
jgi:secreted PhoX family phosphatase